MTSIVEKAIYIVADYDEYCFAINEAITSLIVDTPEYNSFIEVLQSAINGVLPIDYVLANNKVLDEALQKINQRICIFRMLDAARKAP